MVFRRVKNQSFSIFLKKKLKKNDKKITKKLEILRKITFLQNTFLLNALTQKQKTATT